METIVHILIVVFVFFIYLLFTTLIADKFSKSKGINRIFWFFILVITFSWLFGSSNNSSNSSSTPLNSSNDDETFYYDDDFDCQEDFYSYEDYDSCDYDD